MPSSLIALNKQARHDYEIIEKFTAGIKLTGAEVKAAKSGQLNLQGAYALVSAAGRPYLVGCHISPYKPAAGSQRHYDPTRSRALLLKKKEIKTLQGKLKEKSYTLVPLALYNQGGLIKVELGLGRGRREYEKRELIKKRDLERELGRRLRR